DAPPRPVARGKRLYKALLRHPERSRDPMQPSLWRRRSGLAGAQRLARLVQVDLELLRDVGGKLVERNRFDLAVADDFAKASLQALGRDQIRNEWRNKRLDHKF